MRAFFFVSLAMVLQSVLGCGTAVSGGEDGGDNGGATVAHPLDNKLLRSAPAYAGRLVVAEQFEVDTKAQDLSGTSSVVTSAYRLVDGKVYMFVSGMLTGDGGASVPDED